jgi:DNA-binding Lrp family transcriptional regulator
MKIIDELRRDGLASNMQIAGKIGVSVSTVTKKFNAMVENGVIVIKALPNPYLMGYRSLAVIGLSVDLKRKNDICRQLTKHERVHMVTTCFGRFDILSIVFFQDMDKTYNYIKKLPKIDGIYNVETFFIQENKKWSEKTLKKGGESAKPTELDDLDRKIIIELLKDGRPNYSVLATRLGTSNPTISRRIRTLLEKKYVWILAIPDPSKLNYSMNAYILINAEHDLLDSLMDQLTIHPEVHLIMSLVNNYELFLGVYGTDLEALDRFLENNVWNMEGILKSETLICGNYFYFNSAAAALEQ